MEMSADNQIKSLQEFKWQVPLAAADNRLLPKKQLIWTQESGLLELAVMLLSRLAVFLLAEGIGPSWPSVLCWRQSHQTPFLMIESDWHTANETLHHASGFITALSKETTDTQILCPHLIKSFPFIFTSSILLLIPRTSKHLMVHFKKSIGF